MTEGVTIESNERVLAPADAGLELAPYAKDYWDNAFEQIGRRRLVKLAIAVLALLYASAIYAPLIASDRPYVLAAKDEVSYDRARRGLVGVVNSVHELAAGGRAGYGEKGRQLSFEGALDAQRPALADRLDTMALYLTEEQRAPLADLDSKLDDVIEATLAGAPDAAERAASLRSQARELRQAFEVGPEVPLRTARSFPLLESISWIEVFFMVLWACLLAWPIWNRIWNARLGHDRDRMRTVRRTKVLAVLAVASLGALVWGLTIGGSLTFASAPYKDGLTAGTIQAETVIFPPLAIGFAETHVEESYRPPTWTRNSEIGEDGYYVRGPRMPEIDKVTGKLPATSPVSVRYGEPERNAAARHILGTDILGRDLFARLLWGGRISLSVGLISTFFLLTIGIFVGAVAGYAGGKVDLMLSRLIEIVQSVPAFFLILTAVALVPSKVVHPIVAIVIVIAVVRWTGVARLVRGEFLKLKEQDFVVAARASGLSTTRVIFRHVLPNAMGPVLVAAAFSVAAGILTESAVSFLGFGVKDPIPSWGSVLNESKSAEHWWIQVFPGLLIFVTVFCYNLVGEGLRDALDPRMKV
ncbi:MAG: ABC transporter permease [Planctomycetota bacterium]